MQLLPIWPFSVGGDRPTSTSHGVGSLDPQKAIVSIQRYMQHDR
jgi:hypothetical protein